MSRFVRFFCLLILVAAFAAQSAPQARAATVGWLRVRCNYATAQGHVEVKAPYVRIQIAPASNLTTILASDVVPVRHKGTYSLKVRYPAQPEGTLLIVAIGEWDGNQYLRPATMTSQTCHGGGLHPIITVVNQ